MQKCVTSVYGQNEPRHEAVRESGGVSVKAPYSDPDFDGKQPVEVLQQMKRAKMWLEAKGYTITLKGTYTVTKEVKF